LLCIPITAFSQENGSLTCTDGIDNDGDGLIDCDDPDCQALPNDGCTICPGGISFGDVLIEHIPGCNLVDSDDTESVLGLSDNPVNTPGDLPQALFLGDGGSVKIGFTDNLLINSGDSDPDLWVFEVGTAVEPSRVAIRPMDAFTLGEVMSVGLADSNNDGFFEVGGIAGATSSVDIDSFLPGYANGELKFDAVEISDVAGDSDFCNGNTPGSDIDAVCALFTQPVDCEGTINGTLVIDDCGNCLEPDDPDFNNCSDCLQGSPGTLVPVDNICFGETAFVMSNDDAQIPEGSSLVFFISEEEVPMSTNDILVQSTDGFFEMPQGVSAGSKLFVFVAIVDENGVINFDPSCGNISQEIGILWLEPIEFIVFNDCDTATGELSVLFQVTGGLPTVNGNTYDVTGLASVTVEQNEEVIVNLGSFDGQSYFIEAIDEQGCFGQFLSDPVACIKNPITLNYFRGEMKADGNLLEWETATELNNDFFHLERSNGEGEWEVVTQIDGAGDSVKPLAYDFFDENGANDTYYYRLKSVDFNGSFEYSNVVSLERFTGGTSFTMYPNPVVTSVQVLLESAPRSTTIRVLDVSGKEMYYEKLPRFQENVEFNLEHLTPGIYFVLVENDKLEMAKFLKQ